MSASETAVMESRGFPLPRPCFSVSQIKHLTKPGSLAQLSFSPYLCPTDRYLSDTIIVKYESLFCKVHIFFPMFSASNPCYLINLFIYRWGLFTLPVLGCSGYSQAQAQHTTYSLELLDSSHPPTSAF